MVVYYINKTSDTVNECGFPVKQGDICLLLQKFDIKTIYIDSPVEADSIWRDFRFLDNKSLKSVQFPKTNAIICRPTSNGMATGDAVLLQNLIESCTGEWLKDFLSETLSILNGFNTYWDIDGLKRFTRDDELVMHVEEPEESNNSAREEEGIGLQYTDIPEEETLSGSQDDDDLETGYGDSRKELADRYRLLVTFCLEALIDFNPEMRMNHIQVMSYILKGHTMSETAELTHLTRERIRQIYEKYIKETRENKERLLKEVEELRVENRKLRYLLDSKSGSQDNVLLQGEKQGDTDQILSMELDDIDLPVRAKGVLRGMRVRYLGDIPKISELDLFRQPNCGRKTVKDVKDLLSVYNLRLGMTNKSMMSALRGEEEVEEIQQEVSVPKQKEETSTTNIRKYYCIVKMGGIRTESSVRAARPLPADRAEELFRGFLRDKGMAMEKIERIVNSLKVDFAELVNTHIQPEEIDPFFSYTSVYGIQLWFSSLQYIRPMEFYDPGKLNVIKNAVEYYTECLKDGNQIALRRQLRDEYENGTSSDVNDSSNIIIEETKVADEKAEDQPIQDNAAKEQEEKHSEVKQESQDEDQNTIIYSSFEDYLTLHYSYIQAPFKQQILGKINKILQELYNNDTDELTSYTDIEEVEIIREDIRTTQWYQENPSSMKERIDSLVNDYLDFLKEQKKVTDLGFSIKDSIEEFIQSLRVIEHNVRMIDSQDSSAYDYIKYYSEEIDKIQRKIDNFQIKLGQKTNRTLPVEDYHKRLHAVKQLAEAASLLNESSIYDMLSQIDYGNPVKCEEFSLEEVIAVLNNWDSEVSSQEETNVMAMPISTPTFEGWLYRPDGAPVWTTFHVLPGTNPETDGAYWYALTIDGEKMPECLAGCIGVNVNDEPVFVDYGRVALTSDRPISQGGDFDHKDKYLQAVGNGIPRAIYDRIWFGGKVFGYIIAAYRQVPDRKEGLAWLEKHFQKES